MRITWVCPFPLSSTSATPLRELGPDHSSSWVVALRDLLDERDDVSLSLVVPTTNYDDEVIQQAGRSDIVIKRVPRMRRVPLGGMGILSRSLRRTVGQTDPDLVMVWGTEHVWSTPFLDFDKPVVFRVQGVANAIDRVDHSLKGLQQYTSFGALAAVRERKIFKNASHFAVQTAWDLEWVRHFNPSARCFFDTCQVREEFYEPSNRAPADPPEILSTGTTTLRKGLPELLKIAAQLRARCPGLVIHLVGTVPPRMMSQYRDLVEHAGDAMKFHGALGPVQIRELMTRSTCFVSPTWMESYGMAVVEAQIQGLPIVTSAVGALPAWIDDRQDGLLCEPGSPAGYVKAVLRLLDDPAEAKRLGDNGERSARRRHDRQRGAEQHVDIYRTLLGRAT